MPQRGNLGNDRYVETAWLIAFGKRTRERKMIYFIIIISRIKYPKESKIKNPNKR